MTTILLTLPSGHVQITVEFPFSRSYFFCLNANGISGVYCSQLKQTISNFTCLLFCLPAAVRGFEKNKSPH